MTDARLRRLVGVLIAIVATAGVISAGIRSATPPQLEAARAVIIAPVSVDADPVVPVSVAAEEALATTTVPPTTTPPATAPTTTAPPATAPTTTAPPPPPAPTTTAAPVASSGPSASMTACEREMFDRMNGARAAEGTAPLVADGQIVPIARRWSDELAARQDLQHNPDYGPQVFAARPEATRAAENVGRTHGSNEGLFYAFMESDGHRHAILEAGHTHAGVGCTVDSGGQLWVTVNFWG
ncbi:CAP domain-containing protein [Actinospongicola halichondriae]|uniref:CAP domain-containing protein n=1 Tax=Actinospongicola halichondriae TaxID=3236844 RepID=UPI003D4354D5